MKVTAGELLLIPKYNGTVEYQYARTAQEPEERGNDMPELIGLLVGLVAGVLFPWAIPSQYSLYVAAGLLAGAGFRPGRLPRPH